MQRFRLPFFRLPQVPALLQIVLVNVICVLCITILVKWGTFDSLDRALLNHLFRTRGSRYPSPDIVLVVADNSTVNKFRKWPLPRAVFADVVEHLGRAGAKTIALDIIFTAPSNPVDDARLAAACAKAGRVIHATAFELPATPLRKSVREKRNSVIPATAPLPTRFAVQADDTEDAAYPEAVQVTAPLPELRDSAVAIGHVNVPPDRDGVLRQIPHLIRYQQNVYPSFSLAAAAHYRGIKPQQIQVSTEDEYQSTLIAASDDVKLHLRQGSTFPLDREGQAWINWVGAWGSFPTFSFEQLLQGRVPDQALKGRLVLVGATSTAAYEYRTTPFSPVQPAVEVQANALNDILLNQSLRQLPVWVLWIVIPVCGLLVGLLTFKRGAWAGALGAAIAAGLLYGSAFLLLAHSNLLLPVVAPLTATALALGSSLGYLQLQGSRDLKQSVLSLQEAEERYALAVRGANDGIWDWDLLADEIHYSPRWKEILGLQDEAISNQPEEWLSRIHPEDAESVKTDLAAHLGYLTAHFENEHRIRHQDGSYRWVLIRGLALRGEMNVAHRISGSLTDITERKQVEQQLQHNAFHDPLTELPNRALFMDRLEQVMKITQRQQHLFAVLFLDVDRFKVINDSLGHAVGDQLLAQIGQRLKKCLRPGDTLARFGGDEFTLLLDGLSDVKEVTSVVEKIRLIMATPFALQSTLEAHHVSTSASIGIAFSSTGYQDAHSLVRDADIAMYRAKSKGPAQHEVFDQEMHSRALTLLQIENELRQAIDLLRQGQSQFCMVYQPIVSLETGFVHGFEALVRWIHPERGFVAPSEFIPLAEDTRLILPLSEWVLREACCQLHAWQQQFQSPEPLFMSVNLSVKELAEANLVERVQSLLTEIGLNPKDVKLEITESAIMDNAEAASAKLNQLKALGIRLSMDDFGTGYSSLSYLHRFPLDTLKIDRSFISRIGPSGENSELVWTIIALARNLGLDIVAEGVETAAQVEQLRTLVCDYGQGYFFAKPLECDAATALLEQMPRW
jgi:diguanylate cyclase (GGDEF)-like protein/PAS domain S-box-containing protein